MNEPQALRAFAALAQETRLRVLRSLVQAGPAGVVAGALATQMGVSASNISFHLKELERADLITARRRGQSIIYAAAFPALAALLQFLMQDCCDGRPEICAPALALPCCAPQAKEAADV